MIERPNNKSTAVVVAHSVASYLMHMGTISCDDDDRVPYKSWSNAQGDKEVYPALQYGKFLPLHSRNRAFKSTS